MAIGLRDDASGFLRGDSCRRGVIVEGNHEAGKSV